MEASPWEAWIPRLDPRQPGSPSADLWKRARNKSLAILSHGGLRGLCYHSVTCPELPVTSIQQRGVEERELPRTTVGTCNVQRCHQLVKEQGPKKFQELLAVPLALKAEDLDRVLICTPPPLPGHTATSRKIGGGHDLDDATKNLVNGDQGCC